MGNLRENLQGSPTWFNRIITKNKDIFKIPKSVTETGGRCIRTRTRRGDEFDHSLFPHCARVDPAAAPPTGVLRAPERPSNPDAATRARPPRPPLVVRPPTCR